MTRHILITTPTNTHTITYQTTSIISPIMTSTTLKIHINLYHTAMLTTPYSLQTPYTSQIPSTILATILIAR